MTWNIRALTSNVNTGIEYEYALYYTLLDGKERNLFKSEVIDHHPYKVKIERIASTTNLSAILVELKRRHLTIEGSTIETQNDEIGPSDIVLHLRDSTTGRKILLGISVKYQNACTMNITGRSFLRERDIEELRLLQREYSCKYIESMSVRYGNARHWFRKRLPSDVTDEYIDLLRARVVANWQQLDNKISLVASLFQMNSPIDYWVYEYRRRGEALLHLNPPTIDISKVNAIRIEKYKTSYVAFFLENRMIGKMQVKFNNGFLERCKKVHPDFIVDGIPMSLGSPFSSWNFSVVYGADGEG